MQRRVTQVLSKVVRRPVGPGSAHILYITLSLVVFTGVSTAAIIAQPTKRAPVHAATTSAKKPVSKPVAASPKPVTATPTPAPAPIPTVTVQPRPAGQPTTTRVAPVVTPAPSSNVNGLTPSTPPAQSQTPASPPVTTGYTSTNWSGYLATGRTFTAVRGSWIAPSATGNGVSTSADATWVGIGGVTAGDLIQVGTQNVVSASGQVTTYAWFEMLPAFEQQINTMVVHPGDSITASVVLVSGSQWTITITDNSDSQSFSITVAYASSLSSAEWIEEDPSYGANQLVPFDNFTGVSFSGGSALANGISVSMSGSNALPVTLVNGSGQPIAVPSAIGGDGASFSVSP